MDELDVSKQAAAGLGKISVDFLCEEGRAHITQHGRGWRKVQLPPESQPEGQTWCCCKVGRSAAKTQFLIP